MAITSSFGATAITGPNGPTNVDQVPIWVTDRSEGGTRYSYKSRASTVVVWQMTFGDLTAAEKAALQSFFDNTAQGPSNTFTYTHSNGAAYTARFVDTSLRWTRSGPALWAVTVTLELSQIPT